MPTTTFPRRSNHHRRAVLPLRISIAALALTAALSGCDSETATPATSTTGATTSAATAESTDATDAPNAANSTQPARTTTSPAAGTVSVPDVRGDRPALADQLLTAAGLHAHITGATGRGPGGGQCVITTQNPDAGASVPTGTTVELSTGEVGGQSPC
ncbi:PASTA domain-containing protein [Nocardia nova]|uniref:PASTA domain-containing protein n=1 Tax=Nocardia nova TaxID=37330 RepID=UPI0015E35B81|nr:PASTA domain-containing protein [Nocardia nova]